VERTLRKRIKCEALKRKTSSKPPTSGSSGMRLLARLVNATAYPLPLSAGWRLRSFPVIAIEA
jgi:hypothetical protein